MAFGGIRRDLGQEDARLDLRTPVVLLQQCPISGLGPTDNAGNERESTDTYSEHTGRLAATERELWTMKRGARARYDRWDA